MIPFNILWFSQRKTITWTMTKPRCSPTSKHRLKCFLSCKLLSGFFHISLFTFLCGITLLMNNIDNGRHLLPFRPSHLFVEIP